MQSHDISSRESAAPEWWQWIRCLVTGPWEWRNDGGRFPSWKSFSSTVRSHLRTPASCLDRSRLAGRDVAKGLSGDVTGVVPRGVSGDQWRLTQPVASSNRQSDDGWHTRQLASASTSDDIVRGHDVASVRRTGGVRRHHQLQVLDIRDDLVAFDTARCSAVTWVSASGWRHSKVTGVWKVSLKMTDFETG